MFTAEELKELGNSIDAREKELEKILANCKTEKTINVIMNKLAYSDALAEKVKKIIEQKSYKYVPIKRIFRFGKNL